jgi:hypothetical protein
LQSIPNEDARLYVFDISLDANRADLDRLLKHPGIEINWYDHHEAGEIPTTPRLRTRILNARGTCTALLAHADFPGSDPRWAAMAAFGDNLPQAARALLAPLGLDDAAVETWREAGELINYNAHGETPEDVLFQPLDVAERMSAFRDPEAFVRESGIIEPLRAQMKEDEHQMGGLRPERAQEGARLYRLPAESWARRLGSTFASREALAHPECAVAMMHPLRDGAFQVSIRAPRGAKDAPFASDLAREFPTGGGRALAAGINRLPPDRTEAFARRFFEFYR